MPSLIQIAEGWYQFVKGDANTRNRMRRRLAICDDCPMKVQTTGVGKVLAATMGNDPENTYSCGLCHCPLGALASLKDPGCKAGKWNHIV